MAGDAKIGRVKSSSHAHVPPAAGKVRAQNKKIVTNSEFAPEKRRSLVVFEPILNDFRQHTIEELADRVFRVEAKGVFPPVENSVPPRFGDGQVAPREQL